MRLFALLSAVLVMALSGTVAAQDESDESIRHIYFDTLRTGDVQPTPLAVEDMVFVGTEYISARDSMLMAYATKVVQGDLDFYADFELVVADPFYMQLYEIEEMNLPGWKRMGAIYLVTLEAEFLFNNMRVIWRLWDTDQGEEFAKGTVERPKDSWRRLGHEVSNQIVHTLTGEEGIFMTRIAYARMVDGAKELFVSDYDGAETIQVTDNGSINLSPVFHPQRPELYFISYMDGDPSLYVANLETGSITKITDTEGMVAAPAISPDGDKIACVLTKDGNSEIYVLRLDGSVLKRLTRHWAIDTAPTWSPDGEYIAFASDRSGAPQVYIMDSDGLNVRRLTYKGRYNDSPVWSDDGRRVLFVTRLNGYFEVASIDTSGADYRVLTATALGHDENPHFSPDGKHVIFSSDRPDGKNQKIREIFTMDVTGRNQRRLTHFGACSNPTWGPLP